MRLARRTRRGRIGAGQAGHGASGRGFDLLVPCRLILLAAIASLAGACDDYPRDPSDTYERVRGGTMVVGYLVDPPWVTGGPEPAGLEADLVRELAGELDARVAWVQTDGETALEALELREIALVVGGLTRSNPWSRRVAFTRPYATTQTVVAGPEPGVLEDLDGRRVAVRLGSPAGRWVEDAGGRPVREEEAGPEVELGVTEAHDLEADEHLKMVLKSHRHVVAVPPGENRWLIVVDRFFTSRALRVRQALAPR